MPMTIQDIVYWGKMLDIYPFSVKLGWNWMWSLGPMVEGSAN